MTGSSSGSPYPPSTRVLVVVSGWPRLSETFAVNEITALHRAGMLAGIAATKPGDPALVQPGLDELEPFVTHLPDGDAAAQAEAVVALAERLEGPVDAVHGYFAHRPAEVAMLAAGRLAVPFGFSVHALDLRKVEPVELRRRAAAAAVVVTCNTDAYAALAAEGVNAHLVPHGVDLHRFAPTDTDRQHAGGGHEVRLVAVGRLVEKKGFPTLLDAVAQLADTAVTLTIVGDGPERASMEAQIARLGIAGRVTLAGRTTHDELPTIYRDADIVVVPSVVDSRGDRDGLPNVVLEAMACGRTVVASDVAAIASAITGGTDGVLVSPGDAAALATAIRSVAADPARRTALGAAARRTALGAAARRTAEQHFELDRCSHRFCELLVDAFTPVTAGATQP
jgi:glycosyltransferase involved in cell wall biosynthesis